MAKTAPWAPQAIAPLSNGSLTLFAKRVPKPGRPKSSHAAPEVKALTAAATRVTASPSKDRITRHLSDSSAQGWQEEVLAAAAQIGELRYIVNTTANAASRAWVFPASERTAADQTNRSNPAPSATDNAPEEDGAPPGALDPEIVRRAAQLIVLIGEFYVVELPRPQGRPRADDTGPEVHILAPMDVHFEDDDYVRIGGTENGGRVTGGLRYRLSGPGAAKVTRVHRPDVRNAEQPDSAARSALPVMRELIGLSMHVSATIDSRLAGAGIVEYPADAQVTGPSGEAPFADALQEAMVEPISDRDHASAVTPILVGVPPAMGGGSEPRLKWHLSPGSTLDANIHVLRDDCIRRLALGMDAPPEVILGAKGLSHFGAWSVEGEFIRLQIAPLLKLICDGLSVAFGIEYTFDTGPLTVRPNKAVEAQALYDRGVLSDESLRAACGFSEDDKPQDSDREQQAHDLAVAMVRNSPSLLQTPGFPAVVDQFRISFGLPAKFQDFYPGQEAAPLAGSPNKNDGDPGANGRENPRNGGDGEQPESNRPVSDGSPEGGADGQPHDVPGTD